MMQDDRFHEFKATVWDFYARQGRHDLPWRQAEADGSFDPYKILVSEIMLQQTQVGRVVPKYHNFLQQFPTPSALAQAELGDVLRSWNGLGYNRRAKFLWQAAQDVQHKLGGIFPRTLTDLIDLPGVGPNTAGAIAAYAFNEPLVFIETNLRTVYIHHFFHGHPSVTDKEVLALIGQTLDRERPREWYWALMDYGSSLKQQVGNLSRRSASYTKQSSFHGSKRYIRGQVIKQLTEESQTLNKLSNTINDDRLQQVVADLLDEGLIKQQEDRLYL